MVVLAAMLALFDQVEGLRPLLPEELSARYVVEQVREGRNQLLEERFGRGEAMRSGRHPAARSLPRQHQDDHD